MSSQQYKHIPTKYKRTDIVFYVYLTSSLKFETRSNGERGVRRRVTRRGKLPTNWRNFLRDNDNKTDLFTYLANTIGQMSTSDMVIATKVEEAVSNHCISLHDGALGMHEEADTGIFVHARHATEEGRKVIMLKASDQTFLS